MEHFVKFGDVVAKKRFLLVLDHSELLQRQVETILKVPSRNTTKKCALKA